jgi:hypothetical protein
MPGSSRTDLILRTVRAELERRRVALDDHAADIVSVRLVVKLGGAGTWVRAVVYEEERVVRSTGPGRAT